VCGFKKKKARKNIWAWKQSRGDALQIVEDLNRGSLISFLFQIGGDVRKGRGRVGEYRVMSKES